MYKRKSLKIVFYNVESVIEEGRRCSGRVPLFRYDVFLVRESADGCQGGFLSFVLFEQCRRAFGCLQPLRSLIRGRDWTGLDVHIMKPIFEHLRCLPTELRLKVERRSALAVKQTATQLPDIALKQRRP